MQKVKYITLLLILLLVALTSYYSADDDKNIETSDKKSEINQPIMDEEANSDLAGVDKNISNSMASNVTNPENEFHTDASTKRKHAFATDQVPIPQYTSIDISAPHMDTEAKGVSLHNYVVYDLLSVLVPLGVLILIIFILLPLYFYKK